VIFFVGDWVFEVKSCPERTDKTIQINAIISL